MEIAGKPVTSPVLKNLNHCPNSICGACRAALWMQTRSGKIQIYCRTMRVLIDHDVRMCDGQAEAEALAQKAPG